MNNGKKEITYANTGGVDRDLRKKSKEALSVFDKSHKRSKFGKIIQLPFGLIFPNGHRGSYTELIIEGVGTKVLIAKLAGKFDTIGIDAVAMAVNDIRSGAKLHAIADNIHAEKSDPYFVQEWLKGIAIGAEEADCPVVGGEIGDVPDVVKVFDMVVSATGEVKEKNIIFGNTIVPGDVMIGVPSNGVHSNGISGVRKIIFKEWGGKFEPFDIPDGFDQEIVFEVLKPTKIYVKPLMSLVDKHSIVKGVVHVTGDGYLKFENFMKFSKGIGFEFDNFHPQPIFDLIQNTVAETKGYITDEEMFKTYNMGWGEIYVVSKDNAEPALKRLKRCGGSGAGAEVVGKVTNSGKIIIQTKNRRFELKR